MPVQLTDKQIRRRANERSAKRLRNKQAKVSGRKPERDPEYLNFIRSLRCCVPSCTSVNLHKWPAAEAQTEAAHVGERGLRQKCSDREVIPLCGFHHRTGPEAHHVLGKNFWKHHNLDREVLIAAYNLAYQEAE